MVILKKITKQQGVIGKFPHLCFYWFGKQWLFRLGKYGIGGIGLTFINVSGKLSY